MAPGRTGRRRAARCALLGDRHHPPPSRPAWLKRPHDIADARRRCRTACWRRPAAMLKPGGLLVYCGLLARARGRRRADRGLPRAARPSRRCRSSPTRSATSASAHARGRACAPCPATGRARRPRRVLRRTSAPPLEQDQRPRGASQIAAHLISRPMRQTGPNRAVDPCRGFRAARRGSPRDRQGRRRLHPCRRDGRPFRAEHHHRPERREGAAPARRTAVRRPSDDRAGRSLHPGIRRSRRRHHHRAPGSRPAPPPHASSSSSRSARRPACRSIRRRRSRRSSRSSRRSTSCW